MKPRLVSTLIFLLLTASMYPQDRVKNLIVMIPDGTSSSVLSLARWYKFGVCAADNCRLAIDPHICGLVSTYNSDSPIGDSAPTGSTYATGYLSNSGFVATYPISSGKGKDLIKIDPLRAYHPLITLLEAARFQGKSTGLVVTSEFTHATPADFSSHTYERDEKEDIAIQIVHNHLNVVFGGGLNYLDPAIRKDGKDLLNVLRTRNYKLVSTVDQFEALTPEDSLVYGLFAEEYLPNNLDRNPEEVPSLAEMTRKAIKILSQSPNGFFLMVEGSKVDWSAHANDPVGTITEFLAFDDAVEEAMGFANRDGNTAVVIAPDHGNGGISLGNSRSNGNYDVLPINDLIQPLRACKMTGEGISRLINANPSAAGEIFSRNTSIMLSPEEIRELIDAANNADENLLPRVVARLITNATYVGFTTTGHTGEDVMLAVYHPGNYRPSGVIKPSELNHYMTEILGVQNLDVLTEKKFCIDSVALQGADWDISGADTQRPKLIIRSEKTKNLRAEIDASTDYITIFRQNKPFKTIPLGSVAIYVKPLGHFFVPNNSGQLIAQQFLRSK
ncbi:MAG: alkaline phosphatase [Bacteroidales bacterium]|nr:alkaline phosphatase [Bacteroidales bacterium]